MQTPRYAALDDALAAVAPFDIELRNGNSNHAPMVAEALCSLGRPDAVAPWLDRYRPRMQPRPAPGQPIGADWQAALGRRDRFADWAVFFAEELSLAGWPDLLDRWIDRLAPGFCAAATHGPIRVGHAVRGLSKGETPARRRELGDALAGWAATYRELPVADVAAPRADPRQAIAAVPIVPRERRRAGNIVAGLAGLADFPEFASVIGLLDTSGDLDARFAALADAFACVFIAHARNIPTAIAFIHAVTSLSALANMAPHLAAGTTRRTLGYAWQAAAGIYACYAGEAPSPASIETSENDPAALSDGAVANGDEHVIKFTEACLTRHAVCASPAYPAAVTRLLGIMPRR